MLPVCICILLYMYVTITALCRSHYTVPRSGFSFPLPNQSTPLYSEIQGTGYHIFFRSVMLPRGGCFNYYTGRKDHNVQGRKAPRMCALNARFKKPSWFFSCPYTGTICIVQLAVSTRPLQYYSISSTDT